MDLQLAGKRAIVTGGSRGIGFAVARALLSEGAQVALVARTPDRLRTAAAQLATIGPPVVAIEADATDDGAVRAAVAEAADVFGGLDILVNSAAEPGSIMPRRALAELTDDDLRLDIEAKVLGYLRFSRAAAPYMTAQGWGRIINVGGLATRRSGNLVGSVRNVAVAAMTKNLADQLGSSGVNVTVVHPDTTVTERTPDVIRQSAADTGLSEQDVAARMGAPVSIGRLVTAAEVADVITFLASPRSVAINGDAIAVGGGARGQIHY
jgi:NAD(P)-dependent dehydrogenase (short-subunit alcohol dehydrogenase family)